MPTNLPPEYFDAERRYKQAATSQEKIAALEELISTVLKHKGTDRLRADLLVVAAEVPQDLLNIDRNPLPSCRSEGALNRAVGS